MGHTKIEVDGADELSTVMLFPGLEPRETRGTQVRSGGGRNRRPMNMFSGDLGHPPVFCTGLLDARALIQGFGLTWVDQGHPRAALEGAPGHLFAAREAADIAEGQDRKSVV